MIYDTLIIGGGPAGLSAALTLGRSRKKVLLCNSGTPRNIRAQHVQGFITRDGISPADFRHTAIQEISQYPSVELKNTTVLKIDGELDAFQITLQEEKVTARRLLLCTGMIDELPSIPGFSELWAYSIFPCPYCHGWEFQNKRFAVLCDSPPLLNFAILLRGWSDHITAVTNDAFPLSEEDQTRLRDCGVSIEQHSIEKLEGNNGEPFHVYFQNGKSIQVDVMFARPRQHQVPLVDNLNLELTPAGFVAADAMLMTTSRSGVYAAGDLTTPGQSAVAAAAAGMQAAAMLNQELTLVLASEN